MYGTIVRSRSQSQQAEVSTRQFPNNPPSLISDVASLPLSFHLSQSKHKAIRAAMSSSTRHPRICPKSKTPSSRHLETHPSGAWLRRTEIREGPVRSHLAQISINRSCILFLQPTYSSPRSYDHQASSPSASSYLFHLYDYSV